MLENLRPEWSNHISDPIAKKKDISNIDFNNTSLFPFTDQLGDGVDAEAFALSFLQQPKLFLRLRPGHLNTVKAKLKAIAVDFESVSEHTIAIHNGTKIDEELDIDTEAVVQDLTSQQIGETIKQQLLSKPRPATISLWDCCAASGGKSIMLHDLEPAIKLTVSDVRPSILHNLRHRFQRAGITDFQSFVADLTSNETNLPVRQKFDWVLADVPCTGSGTWSRTPEQMYFFDTTTIEDYALRQKRIVDHTVKHIQENGYLIYITCSVFKKENEEAVAYIRHKHRLALVHQQLLIGYDKFADTMFIAILQKKNHKPTNQ